VIEGGPPPGYGGYHRPEDDFHLRNVPRHPLPHGPYGGELAFLCFYF
jgi:hypothetical protein